MAIDPRIALAVQAPNIAPAINIFENALMNAQTRDLRAQQAQQAQALAPFQLQQAQQNVDINQQALDAGQIEQELQSENRIIRSVAEFGTRLKPALESGNTDQALTMLTERFTDLQSQGLPTNETVEAITAIRNGDSQGVVSSINAAQDIARQRGLTGTSGAVQSSQFIPGVGFATLSKGGQVDLKTVEGVGETVAEKRTADIEKSAQIEQQKSKLQGLSAAKKLAVTKSGVAFDKLANIDVAMSNFDDAIRAIDEGAQTGTIISSLPSFRKSSIELDNIQKSLGLDVVSNTTFGALSESELKFALDKALPKNLQPQDLKTWLQAKKSAQLKLRDHISDAAQFLGTGENTIPDWIELQKARAIIQQEQPEQVIATEAAPLTQQVQPVLQPSAGNADVPDSTSSFAEGQTATGPNGQKAVFTNGQWVVQ